MMGCGSKKNGEQVYVDFIFKKNNFISTLFLKNKYRSIKIKLLDRS